MEEVGVILDAMESGSTLDSVIEALLALRKRHDAGKLPVGVRDMELGCYLPLTRLELRTMGAEDTGYPDDPSLAPWFIGLRYS